MFAEPLPERVDPRQLASDNVVLKGDIPLSNFARLTDYLCDHSGVVRIELQFHQGKRHTLVIIGSVTAKLTMQCQYCLDPVEVDVNTELDLVLVDNDGGTGALDEGVDAVLAQGEQIELVAIVEDDLILGLPMVAKHGSGDCISKLEYDEVKTVGEGPFAELERLKDELGDA
jgi:uncharacterized protein|tara:strand:- start:22752 stop:23267 length:516 start_codon:yes stop_codon:yes gene_type:complete